jgi:hypothetical protein
MGNCQAAEAAAVVIQHPGGKVERLYGAATAAEVMRGNPGHYVALVVLRVSGVGGSKQDADPEVSTGGGARITKVKLLKPKDTLLLGQVYRLITSQGACSTPVLGLDALFLGPVSFLMVADDWPCAQRWRRRYRRGGRTRCGGTVAARWWWWTTGGARDDTLPPPRRAAKGRVGGPPTRWNGSGRRRWTGSTGAGPAVAEGGTGSRRCRASPRRRADATRLRPLCNLEGGVED